MLVERSLVGADVGDAATVGVAEVEDLAVELLVGVEPERPAGAVEREGDVGELLPPLVLGNRSARIAAWSNFPGIAVTSWEMSLD